MNIPQGTKREWTPPLLSMALIGLLGQVGIVTLLILLAALFAGLWLDVQMHTSPVFTLALLIGSIPVSLVAMLVIVRLGLARIKPGLEKPASSQKEETGIGNNA
jgi:uncharacterized membrane protein YedE/YeeE